ncbi:MAG: hypothetical protein WBD86_00080 [Microgenomates group bacterium]
MRERTGETIERADSKLFYGKPETVGKTTVLRVGGSAEDSHEVVLSLGVNYVFCVLSQFVDGVPEGYVKKGQTVEILVRKDKPLLLDALTNKLLNRKHNPSSWFMAIRPFSEETYGKPVDESERVVWKMFEANFRSIRIAPEFHKMFLNPIQT